MIQGVKKIISVPAMVIAVCMYGICTFLVLDALYPLPLPDKEKGFALAVLAEDGSPLRFFPDHKGVWRYPVQMEDVSPQYIQALINYEDRWYWHHPGVNPWSLLRALAVYIREGEPVLGGSTLTMQVARILDMHRRTIPGKLKQIFRALQLELWLSKTQILELYLNYAPFGGPMEGIQAACYAYLGKSAKELSRAEAALMAVLPQAPTRLRPDRHPQRAQKARDKVLRRMAAFDVWGDQTIQQAMLETVRARFDVRPMQAPLLARRVFNRQAENGVIATAIASGLQQTVESFLHTRLSSFPPKTSAAVLIVENSDLFVRAYAGSADYFDHSRFGCVDMVQAVRSPGSTLKPFVYAFALEEGLIHSQSLLMDAPLAISGYRPENFTRGFAGPVSASQALIRSLNIPAVDLLDRLGPDFFDRRLRQGGLDLAYPGQAGPNLAMVLGGVGTTLEDLVGAYASLARDGLAGQPRLTREDLLRERRMMKSGTAYILRQILSSHARPDLPGGRLSLDASRQVAWKTGTSYGFRDAWCIGVTNSYTIGVWVGRPDGTPTPGYYGRAVAAPLVFSLVDSLPQSLAPAKDPPPGVSRQAICWPLGLPPEDTPGLGIQDALCHERKTAWILNGVIPPTLPDRNDELWLGNPVKVLINPETGLRVEADCPVFEVEPRWIARWPMAARPWLPERIQRKARVPELDPACAKSSPTSPESIYIVGLHSGAVLRPPGASLRLPEVYLKALGGSKVLYWLLDGELIARAKTGDPAHYAFQNPGRYTLTVMDLAGNYDSIDLTVLGGNLSER